MLKIVQRFTNFAWSAQQAKLTIQRLQNYASLQMRDIFIEQHEEAGTLFVNFAKHIAIERHKNIEPIKTTIRYANYFPISDNRYFRKELEKTPANQLAALFIFASTYRTNAQPDKLLNMINELDDVAVKQMDKMKAEEILNTLYALLYFAPYWLTRMDFYRLALEKLTRSFQGAESPEYFVQLCFYLGLQKKRAIIESNQFKELLDKHLNKYLPKLSLMDLAIISNAAYKTSTSIESGLFNECLEKEVIKFKLDGRNDGLLINFIKAMRFQRVHSIEVCERLSELCQNPNELKLLQATGLAHLFVYLAENLWDHPNTVEALKESFFRKLENEPNQTRAKDIAMFTWCCAQLKTFLTIDELKFLEQSLVDKVNEGKFKYFPDQLVDSCLSLWILGHRSERLLISAIRQKASLKQKNKHQPKVDSRLTVLMTASAIEEPNWVETYTNIHEAFDKNCKVPSYILKQNTELYGLMESLSTNDCIKSIKMVMPLNGINIPNLLIETNANTNMSTSTNTRANKNLHLNQNQCEKDVNNNSIENFNKEIFIEFLKPEQILHFSQEQVSIIRLKKRLLETNGHRVIFINSKDLENSCLNLKRILISFNCDAASDEDEKEVVLSS